MKKSISNIVLAIFFITTIKSPASAQTVGDQLPILPTPGTMVHLSPAFTPTSLKGIVIHPENALKLDFIIYKGDEVLADSQKSQEYTKLVKYFLASLAIPDDNQWVNLSPYEKDRIIKEDFGKTEMGRDLLAQDYILKQVTASLIYPKDKLGQEFWNKVYAKAFQKFGTSNIPINTFNKVWIIPDDAEIAQDGNMAYVLKNHLKVMLEEDYMSLREHHGIENATAQTHTIASQVVRQIILPALEKEVNEGKNFAMLRQVFSGVVLAAWYKRELRESFLAKIYMNRARVKGVDQDPGNNEVIYQRYLQAFRKGVFNYIKEDVDGQGREIPKKYFSGGTEAEYRGNALKVRFVKDLPVNVQINIKNQVTADEDNEVVGTFQMGERNEVPALQKAAAANASKAMTVERTFNFPSAGFDVSVRNNNQNMVKTSQGVIAVGASMLMRNLLPESDNFPSVFIVPRGAWVGVDGADVMQIYFAAAANFAFHKRKTTIVVRDAAEEQRVRDYFKYANNYDRDRFVEYLPEDVAARLKREAYYLADRIKEEGDHYKISDPVADSVNFVRLDNSGHANIGNVSISEKPNGTIVVNDGRNESVLDAVHLREMQVAIKGQHPLIRPNFGVTFLGTSSGMDPNGLTVNHIVWAGDKGILFDVGAATVAEMMSMGITPRDINYVLITHVHEDHVAGLLAYLHWAAELGQNVNLIVEPAIYEDLKKMMGAVLNRNLEDAYSINHIPLHFYKDLPLGDLRDQILIEAIPAFHGTTTTMARVTYQGRTIGLSSDTTYAPKRFDAIISNHLPPDTAADLKAHTDYSDQKPVFDQSRRNELENFLFAANHDGRLPSLVVYEVGYPKATSGEDLTNHTSPFDLQILAQQNPSVPIITNHTAAHPQGEFSFKQAQALTTFDASPAMFHQYLDKKEFRDRFRAGAFSDSETLVLAALISGKVISGLSWDEQRALMATLRGNKTKMPANKLRAAIDKVYYATDSDDYAMSATPEIVQVNAAEELANINNEKVDDYPMMSQYIFWQGGSGWAHRYYNNTGNSILFSITEDAKSPQGKTKLLYRDFTDKTPPFAVEVSGEYSVSRDVTDSQLPAPRDNTRQKIGFKAALKLVRYAQSKQSEAMTAADKMIKLQNSVIEAQNQLQALLESKIDVTPQGRAAFMHTYEIFEKKLNAAKQKLADFRKPVLKEDQIVQRHTIDLQKQVIQAADDLLKDTNSLVAALKSKTPINEAFSHTNHDALRARLEEAKSNLIKQTWQDHTGRLVREAEEQARTQSLAQRPEKTAVSAVDQYIHLQDKVIAAAHEYQTAIDAHWQAVQSRMPDLDLGLLEAAAKKKFETADRDLLKLPRLNAMAASNQLIQLQNKIIKAAMDLQIVTIQRSVNITKYRHGVLKKREMILRQNLKNAEEAQRQSRLAHWQDNFVKSIQEEKWKEAGDSLTYVDIQSRGLEGKRADWFNAVEYELAQQQLENLKDWKNRFNKALLRHSYQNGRSILEKVEASTILRFRHQSHFLLTDANRIIYEDSWRRLAEITPLAQTNGGLRRTIRQALEGVQEDDLRKFQEAFPEVLKGSSMEWANPESKKVFQFIVKTVSKTSGDEYKALLNYVQTFDQAAIAQPEKRSTFGGIDFNMINWNLKIKCDGHGVPLPLAQQDMAQLSGLEGLTPVLIAIRPALGSELLSAFIKTP